MHGTCSLLVYTQNPPQPKNAYISTFPYVLPRLGASTYRQGLGRLAKTAKIPADEEVFGHFPGAYNRPMWHPNTLGPYKTGANNSLQYRV